MSATVTCLLVAWQASLRKHDFYPGFITERRKPDNDDKGKVQGEHVLKAITKALSGGG